MGTVSNPAGLKSIQAAWAATQSNFGSFYRGGPVVNIGDSSTISTTAAGMAMSQFNGVTAQHTTSYTTSYTTSNSTGIATSATTSANTTTTFTTCLEKGTLVTLPDGREVPVETIRPGDELLSVKLPGLVPETQNPLGYVQYFSRELAAAKTCKTRVASIAVEISGYLIKITTDSANKPFRVTPSHPIFIYDTDEKRFRFVRADLLDDRHKLVDKYLRLVNIRQIDAFEGQFVIYKVDCAPYDVFFHSGVLGHNQKVGGNVTTSAITLTTWVTSYTSTYTTSFTTSNTTSVLTFG